MDTIVEEKKVFTYKTKSLDNLAVSLALGAEVVDVVREPDERFFTFHLKAFFDMEETSMKLASRTLEINAYDVLEANRRAKSIVHSR